MILFFNPHSTTPGKQPLPLSVLSLAAVLEGREQWALVDGNLTHDPLSALSAHIEAIPSGELAVVAEACAEEARSRTRPRDDEIAVLAHQLELHPIVVRAGPRAWSAQEPMARAARQEHEIPRHQLDGGVALCLEPHAPGGHRMERGAADRREIETPRRLRVDMGEHRSGDSGEIEHIRRNYRRLAATAREQIRQGLQDTDSREVEDGPN